MYSVNAIYPTYQGEVNKYGIGAPVIFLRLQGCHLRCYKKSLGELCDTPEGLSKEGGKQMSLDEIVETINKVSKQSGGINYICLSGGDPLWRKQEDVYELLLTLATKGYEVSVETSGTLSMQPYAGIPRVYWVLDYKLKSAAVKQRFCISDIPHLTENDFIKFVIYDMEDYAEFLKVYEELPYLKAKIAIGCYWGGVLKNSQLIDLLIKNNLLGKVVINMQAHKLLTLVDNSDVSVLTIPKEI